MKKSHQDLKFSTLKIKRIIQENKEIGKIANMTPYVISKSLEYFLKELLVECSVKAAAENSSKVYSYHIKNSILSNPNFKFLYDLVDDIPEGKSKKKGKNKKDEKLMKAEDSN